MARFPGTALDMRGALSSNQNNNQALQFSPQMTLSNENFLMLDSNPSPSSSMDLGGLNPSLSSNITSEFSTLLESTSQNSFNIGIGSQAGVGQNDILMPADEWSGTTNTSGQQQQQQQQGLQSSSPSQCQSALSQGQGQGQGQVSQAGNLETKKMQQQYSFDKRLWGSSQNVPELYGVPQPQQGNQEGGGTGKEQAQQQHGFQTGLAKPNFSTKQSSNVLPAVSVSQFQNQAQATDIQAGFLHQQRFRQTVNSQESASHEMKGAAQSMDIEQNQPRQVPGFDGSPKINVHMNNHNHSLQQPGVYQRMEVDNHLQGFPGVQSANQQAMFQRGPALNQQKLIDSHGMQQGELQGDPVMQTMRSLGFQMQGVNPQNAFHPQLQAQYMTLSAQANGHPLSVLLQNRGTAQGQAQMQTLSQPHVQGQAANQQALVNQQAAYQTRHLQPVSHQSPFHSNQQASFHLGQPQANQVLQHGGNSGTHLAGIQNLSQFQARAQNPVFQSLKVGGRQLLQGSPSAALSYVGNNNDAGVRRQIPVEVASECLRVLTEYIQEQKKMKEKNDIGSWRKLVHDFFAPGATERWCLSSYSSSQISRNAQGLFPMEYWFCNICGVQPGRGFEYGTDVLPRLFKIKYDSGLLDEHLCLDTAEESYMVSPGKQVLVFPRAVHESVFPELRVVRYGKLRVTFNNYHKILSWEFCTKVHDEVVPRKNLLQQAQQLTKLVLETEQENFDKDAANLKAQCNAFTLCAKQLKAKLEAPNVNDLGFSKRYVRCLQIAEVVNSMKDLISFENKTHLGPIESLNRFPTIRKLQSEGLLQQSSVTQVMNQLIQGPGNPNSPYAKMSPRLPLPTGQGITLNQASSSVLQGNDPSLSKPSSAMNQLLQVQLRNHLEARNQSMLQAQAANQMQPPSGSHVDTASQGQSHTSNQLPSQFSTQAHSSLQAQHLGQLQSSAPGQIQPQILGCQSPNLNHVSQQMYDQGIAKQINFQPPNSVISQSRSLNRTGQQSLPGTPQSEMSDMRSNA